MSVSLITFSLACNGDFHDTRYSSVPLRLHYSLPPNQFMLPGRQLPSMRVSRVILENLRGGPDRSARCWSMLVPVAAKVKKALEILIGYFTGGQL
jgi:hypothetical protein